MENPEKLATLGTQDDKTNQKHNTICVVFEPSKQTGIIILNWSIEIHNILCYPSSCIPLYTIIYAMH
jgi:hypothetical protein